MKQTLYEDSRQQKGKHERKNAWWRSHNVHVERKKLDFGDYVTDGSNLSIDTKRNMQEVAMDCGRDNRRFAREMDRARDAGYRLVILVETYGKYKSIGDVCKWTNDVCKRCRFRRIGECSASDRCKRYKRRPMTGKTLARIMRTMEEHHGCRFEFVHPIRAARRICDLLGVKYE